MQQVTTTWGPWETTPGRSASRTGALRLLGENEPLLPLQSTMGRDSPSSLAKGRRPPIPSQDREDQKQAQTPRPRTVQVESGSRDRPNPQAQTRILHEAPREQPHGCQSSISHRSACISRAATPDPKRFEVSADKSNDGLLTPLLHAKPGH